jgi:hypothetical protein
MIVNTFLSQIFGIHPCTAGTTFLFSCPPFVGYAAPAN